MVITIAIVVVIMTIVLTNQSKYTESAELTNVITNLSLSLREAQVYGVSVKEVTPGSNDFSAGYGLEVINTNSTYRSLYIFFADRGARNGVYDNDISCPSGGTSECVSKTVLPSGYQIGNICMIPTSGSEDCTMGRVDVTYVRPDTDAHIAFFDQAGNYLSLANIKGARIGIASPSGTTRSVVVYTTGQISIQ